MSFTQLTARLKLFLMEWLLVLDLKECLVEFATVCVKIVVILNVPTYMSYSCLYCLPVLLDFLMQRWQNDKFSNLGIQYHQSELLSKHLEILARIIKNKLEIRNQQNRARNIRRVRKGNKKKSRKIKLLIYHSIFRLWKKGFFEYCKKPTNFFVNILNR